MLADAIELLDRQVAFLLSQRGPDFFMHLPAVIEALGSDPRLEAVIEDLYHDMVRQLEGINARRAEVSAALHAVRKQLVAEYSEVDDSHVPRAVPGDPGARAYESSLARFDKLAEGTRERWPDVRRVDRHGDHLARMIGLLDGKVEIVDPKATDERATPLRLALGNCRTQLEHVQRDYHLATMTSPAVASLRLRAAAAQLNPEPVVSHEPWTVSELFAYAMSEIGSAGGLIRRYAYLGHEGEAKPEDQLGAKKLRKQLCRDLRCLHLETRRRLGLRRSLRGIVDRYKMRAEWHDADELRKLAKKKPPARKGLARTKKSIGKVEVILTANFARYLHDQGLNPLTKIRTGGLEPDVLAPFADPKIRWTFYAEAKQYSKACLPYLRDGINEVADHLTRVRGTAFEVHEAFYIVFRMDGPLYHLPERVPLGDVTVYPVLIDIAPASKSGSRARLAPVPVTVEELMERPGSKPPTRRKGA